MRIKSVLAKTLAVAMAFSLVAIAPDAEAAAKKPTITKKVSVAVGKKKTVKVTSKKKVKKTTWSLTKAGKKVVALSAKKAKSVKVKGKKKGSATLTAKVKVGKKTYKLKSKITVKGSSTTTPTPNATSTPAPTNGGGGNNATPAPTDSSNEGNSTFTGPGGASLTVVESDTYSIPLTELNETTLTSEAKRGSSPYLEGVFNRDGTVTFVTEKDYNSGVSFYINPCTSEDQLTEEGSYVYYEDGAKDVSGYDYIRVKATTETELNCRLYDSHAPIAGGAGYPSTNIDIYEGAWCGPAADYMENDGGTGMLAKPDYVSRTVYIPLDSVASKCNLSTLTAIAIGGQREGYEVTIEAIEFVKVKYDTQVSEITLESNKTEVENGKTATITATVGPENATRKMLAWSSSDEKLATVNFNGIVTAAATGEGTVTITATATDGSGVSKSVDLKIGVAGGGEEVTDHVVDLTNAGIIAQTNNGSGTIDAKKAADGITFEPNCRMFLIKFASYMTSKALDISDYSAVSVEWEVQKDGQKITDFGDDPVPEWGKVALVPEAQANGYDDGINGDPKDVGYVGGTTTISLADADATKVAALGGINIQIPFPEEGGYTLIVRKITFKA